MNTLLVTITETINENETDQSAHSTTGRTLRMSLMQGCSRSSLQTRRAPQGTTVARVLILETLIGSDNGDN